MLFFWWCLKQVVERLMLRGLGGFCMNVFGNLYLSHEKTCMAILQVHGKPIVLLVESFYQAGTWAGLYGGHPPWFFGLDFACHGPMDKMYSTTKPVGDFWVQPPSFVRWII